jgi:hypothetical protein
MQANIGSKTAGLKRSLDEANGTAQTGVERITQRQGEFLKVMLV